MEFVSPESSSPVFAFYLSKSINFEVSSKNFLGSGVCVRGIYPYPLAEFYVCERSPMQKSTMGIGRTFYQSYRIWSSPDHRIGSTELAYYSPKTSKCESVKLKESNTVTCAFSGFFFTQAFLGSRIAEAVAQETQLRRQAASSELIPDDAPTAQGSFT